MSPPIVIEHYEEFARWWMELCSPERHSTRPIEFATDMALDTTPEVIVATLDALRIRDYPTAAEGMTAGAAPLRQLAAQVRCPVLVVHGRLEEVSMLHWAEALAEDTGGELVAIEDAGHGLAGRKPVAFNLTLREFVERVAARLTPS
jgi:pimeloyl-ACP methyl ester carboxylesterase